MCKNLKFMYKLLRVFVKKILIIKHGALGDVILSMHSVFAMETF